MKRSSIYGVAVDRSEHGIWLDRGELFEISEAARKEVGELGLLLAEIKSFFKIQARAEEGGEGAEERQLPCPVCGEPMHTETYQDVYIDRCGHKHGVWLDDGELHTILERLKADPNFLGGMRLRLSDMEL